MTLSAERLQFQENSGNGFGYVVGLTPKDSYISPQLDTSRLLMSSSSGNDTGLNIFPVDPSLCDFGNIMFKSEGWVNGQNIYVEVEYEAVNGNDKNRRRE